MIRRTVHLPSLMKGTGTAAPPRGHGTAPPGAPAPGGVNSQVNVGEPTVGSVTCARNRIGDLACTSPGETESVAANGWVSSPATGSASGTLAPRVFWMLSA